MDYLERGKRGKGGRVSFVADIRAASRLVGADAAEIDALIADIKRVAIVAGVYAALLLALVVYAAWSVA